MRKLLEKLHRFFSADYSLAVLDMDVGSRWFVKPEPTNIAYLKAENAQGRHILIQPALQSYYLLVDDISFETIGIQHRFSDGTWKPGRMVVETSPSNYQVWVHASRPLPLSEKRYWLKRLKSDPGADPSNRWGRCPGFRNRKKKHLDPSGGYPLARLVWIDWKNKAHIPELKSTKATVKKPFFSPKPLEGGVCQNLKISRLKYERGDESATDFAYAVALFRKGLDLHAVLKCLITERTNWQNHADPKRKNAYLKRTLQRAKHIVESTWNTSK